MFDPSSHRFLNNQFIPNDANGFLVVPFDPIAINHMIRFTLISPDRYNVGFTWEPNIDEADPVNYLYPWADVVDETGFLELGDTSYTARVQIDIRTLYGWRKNTGETSPPRGIFFQRVNDFPVHVGIVGFYGECIK